MLLNVLWLAGELLTTECLVQMSRAQAEKPWSRLWCTGFGHCSIELFQDSCYLILKVSNEERARAYPTLSTDQDLAEEIRYTPPISPKGNVETVPALDCYGSHCSMA